MLQVVRLVVDGVGWYKYMAQIFMLHVTCIDVVVCCSVLQCVAVCCSVLQ